MNMNRNSQWIKNSLVCDVLCAGACACVCVFHFNTFCHWRHTKTPNTWPVNVKTKFKYQREPMFPVRSLFISCVPVSGLFHFWMTNLIYSRDRDQTPDWWNNRWVWVEIGTRRQKFNKCKWFKIYFTTWINCYFLGISPHFLCTKIVFEFSKHKTLFEGKAITPQI